MCTLIVCKVSVLLSGQNCSPVTSCWGRVWVPPSVCEPPGFLPPLLRPHSHLNVRHNKIWSKASYQPSGCHFSWFSPTLPFSVLPRFHYIASPEIPGLDTGLPTHTHKCCTSVCPSACSLFSRNSKENMQKKSFFSIAEPLTPKFSYYTKYYGKLKNRMSLLIVLYLFSL